MEKILCATRGGDESFRTQNAAIELAKQRNGRLYFLYVVDTRFINKTSAPIVVDVEGEISKMGEFLLVMAQERAAEQGLDAETILREGHIRDQLKEVVQEYEISLVVFGKPAGEKSVFKLSGLEDFAAEIEKETDAQTMLV